MPVTNKPAHNEVPKAQPPAPEPKPAPAPAQEKPAPEPAKAAPIGAADAVRMLAKSKLENMQLLKRALTAEAKSVNLETELSNIRNSGKDLGIENMRLRAQMQDRTRLEKGKIIGMLNEMKANIQNGGYQNQAMLLIAMDTVIANVEDLQ